jgi:tetratricopeptide (TPR) repeat protein
MDILHNEVKVWEEEICIPTYEAGVPEKNPMFLERRIYQGSSGVVYPHAVIETISDEKVDKKYKAVYLENEYIKLMILPELGGRIQMAFDKIRQRHFIYYNSVIKPALVGLTGPWISGGIEFNWPQHHRPSTFEPVDYCIRENSDGSKTVMVNEVERMFRTKGMAGFTLYPSKAFIEISGNLYNRTPFPQTFLWWANPAVKVNEHYQSVFPPDVYAVYDHGKRDMASFPIAKDVYYKVDYAPGTDISRYANIPVPTSFMAVSSNYNFIGGYEHDSKGGLLHVADHHIAPGKKQWTWGNGEFGKAWDRNLTDDDGPYIELMTGVYTDNQPDFSWLQPFEEKQFVQYFMPYHSIGMVKNASKEAMINLEFSNNTVHIKLYFATPFSGLKILLIIEGEELFTDTIDAYPEVIYERSFKLPAGVKESQVKIQIMDGNRPVLSYQQDLPEDLEMPALAVAAVEPSEVISTEELYLTGLHLEQYRHATFQAKDYYEEALKREPSDSRNNNALGAWYLKRGKFSNAEIFFRSAIKTLTQRNPNPYDGEPFYNLGWSLMMQSKNDEAYTAFYKSTWNDAWQHAGYLNLARLASQRRQWDDALVFIDKSLIKNGHSHTARHLKVCILRKLGKTCDSVDLILDSLKIDPFNFGCLFERYLLLIYGKKAEASEVLEELYRTSRNWEHNFIEYAIDYSHAGMYDEALQFLLVHNSRAGKIQPMIFYYMGWFAYNMGHKEQAISYFKKGAFANSDYCFPNRIEDVPVLQKAIELNPEDAKAPYYLGNFWYDKRQYDEAINCWELSMSVDETFPTVYRNLSLAYYNKRNDKAKALYAMQRAFALDQTDARVLMELDQLLKRTNTSYEERLELLNRFPELVASRDDLYLEKITLLNLLGNYKEAKSLISNFKFHPWEGGEGKVVSQYLICQLELAKQSIVNNFPEEALLYLSEAEVYPFNLGEGKLPGAQENDIQYLQGVAYLQLIENEKAQLFFEKATNGNTEPYQAIFYNDPQPDKIFYQGLAWLQLGENTRAIKIFERLIQFGEQHIDDNVSIDYFAVSLPDLLVFDIDLNQRNRIHCLYLIALGHLGLRKESPSTLEQYFNDILKLDCNHQGALIHKKMISFFNNSISFK